jgi:hypothetical protein
MEEINNFEVHDEDIFRAILLDCEHSLPSTDSKNLSYIASFRLSLETSESQELLANMENTRRDFVSKLEVKTPSLGELEEALSSYLPNLFLFTWSLTNQPSISIKKSTIFEWKGSFSLPDAPKSKYVEFAFEMVMALHTLVRR